FDAGQGGSAPVPFISIVSQWSHGPPELLDVPSPELDASLDDDGLPQPTAARPRRSAAAQKTMPRPTLLDMDDAPPRSRKGCGLKPGFVKGERSPAFRYEGVRGRGEAVAADFVLTRRFVFKKRVARGASGEVLRAFDTEQGVDVAVKRLHAHIVDAVSEERF